MYNFSMNMSFLIDDLSNVSANLVLCFFNIVLLLVVISASFRTFKSKTKESRFVLGLFIIAALASVFEILGYLLERIDGTLAFYFFHINTYINYLSFSVFGFLMTIFVRLHFFKSVSKQDVIFSAIPLIALIFVMVLNIFVPFVFSINPDNNSYSRLWGYYLTMSISSIYIILIALLYFVALKRGKTNHYFPLYIFLIPVIIGAVIQACVSGLNSEWCAITIGLVGVVSSINNEKIFRDELTGLYNRAFFNYSVKSIAKKKDPHYTGIMLDINDFKTINDRFGHDIGDLALKDFANVLILATGKYCPLIRFSGDEFIIILPSDSDEAIQDTICKIKEEFARFNAKEDKMYELHAALGFAKYHDRETAEQFLSEFDKEMYREKDLYHSSKKRCDL